MYDIWFVYLSGHIWNTISYASKTQTTGSIEYTPSVSNISTLLCVEFLLPDYLHSWVLLQSLFDFIMNGVIGLRDTNASIGIHLRVISVHNTKSGSPLISLDVDSWSIHCKVANTTKHGCLLPILLWIDCKFWTATWKSG